MRRSFHRFAVDPIDIVEALRRTGCVVAAVAAGSTTTRAQTVAAPGAAASAPGQPAAAVVLDTVTVTGHCANGIGTSDAASAGDTEPSGAAHRRGIAFSNHCIAAKGLSFDTDASISQARFTSDQGEAPNTGPAVRGSVNTVVSLGAKLTEHGPSFGHVGAVAGVADLRFHPAEPRTFRPTLATGF